MHASAERRRWARFRCAEPTTTPLVRITADSAVDGVLNAFARDMSLGGCSFELDRPIDLPGVLAVKIFLPGGRGTIELEGRTVWKQDEEKGLCIGVAFPGLAESERQLLEAFFRDAAPAMAPTARQQAIAQFERGVLLYHQRQFAQAKREFQKVVRDYAHFIDVAHVALRYRTQCHNEAETDGTP